MGETEKLKLVVTVLSSVLVTALIMTALAWWILGGETTRQTSESLDEKQTSVQEADYLGRFSSLELSIQSRIWSRRARTNRNPEGERSFKDFCKRHGKGGGE